MLSIWETFADAENGPIVGAVSLVLTFLGFVITIIQISRARSAAVAAERAADRAQARMNSFSAVRESELLRANAELVRQAIGKEDWDGALLSYQDVSRGITVLRACNVDFPTEVQTELAEAYDLVEKNCDTIERSMRSDKPILSKGKQFAALRKIDPSISKVIFTLERMSS